jgi:hypothetical protein
MNSRPGCYTAAFVIAALVLLGFILTFSRS